MIAIAVFICVDEDTEDREINFPKDTQQVHNLGLEMHPCWFYSTIPHWPSERNEDLGYVCVSKSLWLALHTG